MKKLLIAISLLLICQPLYAEDVAMYSGSTYLGCRSIGDTTIFLNDPNDYSTIKDGFIYLPNGCSSLPAVAPKYLKQVGGQIVEMTQAEKDSIDNAEIVAQALSVRTGAKSYLMGFSDNPLFQRAYADILKDEINILRQWLADLKLQVALASNFADLKTRVASLPTTPDRTLTQLRTAINNRIDSGTVDS